MNLNEKARKNLKWLNENIPDECILDLAEGKFVNEF